MLERLLANVRATLHIHDQLALGTDDTTPARDSDLIRKKNKPPFPRAECQNVG